MSLKTRSLGTIGATANGITCTGCTAAVNAVLTVGAGHGLKAGDRINISGVTGFTNINGINTVVSVTSTTCTVATNTVGQSTFGGTAVVSQVMDVTPFMAGHSAMCMSIATTALSGGTVLTVEGSDDATTWVDAKTGLALAANTNETCFEVKLYRYMKAKMASWSAGVAQVNLIS
jgi:hypothetical protein